MLTLNQIEAAAPDQASLKAASKLMKPAKWPLRGRDADTKLIWGECQGSGANPYRVMADVTDLGAKCTCPSRKFPCKHSIALMWMFAENADEFVEETVPEWVTDWLGRRRKTGTTSQADTPGNTSKKNISSATRAEPEKPLDPKAEAKKAAAAKKRAEKTRDGVIAATIDVEQWVADQLRNGLTEFLQEMPERCRRISARLVDAKAQALAGRIDELPSNIAGLGSEERLDATITQLGKLILLVRAWRKNPDDPSLHRAVISAETREQIFESDAPMVKARWEVLGERISTRKDGLVSQATWLLNLSDSAKRFALLLDFFPAHLGKRAASFSAGDQFDASLKFYPGSASFRALIAERGVAESNAVWPDDFNTSPLSQLQTQLDQTPWLQTMPITLPKGRICTTKGGRWWWKAESGEALPLAGPLDAVARGAELTALAALWNGSRLDPIAAQSNLGRLNFNA